MSEKTQNIYKKLSELNSSETGIIAKVLGQGSFRKRITEMGFVRGKCVKVIKNAPLMDPVEYEIMGYRVALRRSEAELIEVSASGGDRTQERRCLPCGESTFGGESPNRLLHEKINTINVALVGNPNSGKTSLFNNATGSRERVGNYGGVTVDVKTATTHRNGYKINLTDLPGTYSITEYTPEELYVREHILKTMPDVVINVIDGSNLMRNLYLTTQLIDMNIKVIIALNMYDELLESGVKFDYDMLGRLLGIPVVPTVASRGEGIASLLDKTIDVFEDNEKTVRHIHINYGTDMEKSISEIQDIVWKDPETVARYSSRYIAIKLLENDSATHSLIKDSPRYGEIVKKAEEERAKLEKYFHNEPAETIISDAKYGFIAGALSETLTQPVKKGKKNDPDRLLTHRIWGIPIFLVIMWLMFQTTFTLGGYPMEWIENGVAWLSGIVGDGMSEGPLKELLVNGVLGGVGGVLVFLPNILILFLFISLMEDSGYLARTAFIMDKLMHKAGLHGKSFIPLLMGFGCNVPAIMATRTLESRKDRMITMFIVPFMSCSARLPVYVLLISAFFPKNQGLVLLSIYAAGILVAVISSLILKKTVFPREEAPFVMELPPYRMPTPRSVLRHMWDKGSQYLRKMARVILAASIIIWALGYFPHDNTLPPDRQQEQSYIGRMGKAVEPVIEPLGFDWKIGVSLITGVAAKEIMVSSMAVLNQTDEELPNLTAAIREQYDPLTAYGLMIFVLLYIPCMAVFAAIRKEAGGKWALFSVAYSVLLAWIAAYIIHGFGTMDAAGVQALAAGIIIALAAIYFLWRMVRTIRSKNRGTVCNSCPVQKNCLPERKKYRRKHGGECGCD